MTFTSMWLPSMAVDNRSIKDAIRLSDKTERKRRRKMFPTYIVTVYIVIVVNVVGALCTFGSALLITVPASYFLFICEQFVSYYTVKGKPYFITYEKIATNRDRGDSERFFEPVEDPEDFGILRADDEDGGAANVLKDEAEDSNDGTETDVEMNSLKNGTEGENETLEDGTRETDSKTEAIGENHDSRGEEKR